MRTRALIAALALAAGATGCGGGDEESGGGDGGGQATSTTRVEVIESQGGDGGGLDAQALYEAESPGVVTVVSIFGSGGLDAILGQGGGEEGGVGSGFVLNDKGEIATNAHVVTTGEGDALRGARQVFVEFADGNQVEAEIVGADPNADVALLHVDTDGLELRALPLGSSEKVEVGEPVAAIGSPFGERQSLSVGVVSAVDRSIQSLTQFDISGAIQTDAAINPGNSGGPLVNGKGEVIGINQQIKTNSGGGEGVGFAVPVDAVKRSLDMLRRDGEAHYAYLGVSSVPLYPQLVERFDLGVEQGAWVQEVTPGGPADEAGIRGGTGETTFQAGSFRSGGDVITKVEGRPVATASDLSDVITDFRPGQDVTLSLDRGGQERDVTVRLGERPAGQPAG